MMQDRHLKGMLKWSIKEARLGIYETIIAQIKESLLIVFVAFPVYLKLI